MRKSRFILILFALVGLCVSLGFPAEDVLETTYDESEALPYETPPLYLAVAPQAAARIARVELSSYLLLGLSPVRKRCQRRRENDARRHRVPVSLTILNQSLRC